MISKKTLAALAVLAKVDVATLEAAAADPKEVDVPVADGLQTFTTEELTTRDENTKTASKTEHIKAGKEIMIKELKEKAGLDFQGKDPQTFIDTYKTQVLKDAKIPADAKVTELEGQIQTLRANTANLEAAANQAKAEASRAIQDAKILASLPADRNKTLSDQDYLLLVRQRIAIDSVDGKEVIKNAQGEVFRDKQANPKVLSDVITDVFTAAPGWISKDPKGGRGGVSDPPPGPGGSGGDPKNYTEAEKAWIDQGKSTNTADFASYVSTLAEKNKEFIMDIGGQAPPPGPAPTPAPAT